MARHRPAVRLPQVCITFFTCTGTNVSGTADLEHAYPAAVTYLEWQRVWASAAEAAHRPLRYELVWLDNGGSEVTR